MRPGSVHCFCIELLNLFRLNFFNYKVVSSPDRVFPWGFPEETIAHWWNFRHYTKYNRRLGIWGNSRSRSVSLQTSCPFPSCKADHKELSVLSLWSKSEDPSLRGIHSPHRGTEGSWARVLPWPLQSVTIQHIPLSLNYLYFKTIYLNLSIKIYNILG